MKKFQIQIKNQTFELLPQKAAYWTEKQTLILSDLHLGKSGHFRKSGIPTPSQLNKSNLERLDQLMKEFTPDRVLILGDLFHSDVNREWLQFEEWRQKYYQTPFHLITGNHDRLNSSFYESAQLLVFSEMNEEHFLFIHDPDNVHQNENQTVVAGHIHPAVKIRGMGRQSLRLPCFVISEQRILFPAFGTFTGLHTIKPKKSEMVITIAEDQLIQVQ